MENKVIFRPDPKKEPRKKKEARALKRTPIKTNRKPTGEMEVFKMIAAERGLVCQVTLVPLNFEPSIFAHVLPKGKYPKFRLLKENILVVHRDFHYCLDFMTKEETLKRYPNSGWVFELREKLKQKYREQENKK